jgi:hypothetical protein
MSAPFVFHTGIMVGKNSLGAVSQFGTLQSGSVDLSNTTKELQGQNKYPVAVGVGAGKITGKAAAASIDLNLYKNLYFQGDGVLATGNTKFQYAEAGSIPSATAYTVTVTNSAEFVEDYGVTFADGTPLVTVASGPTAGQYSVAAGVYTFAAADAGKAVLITYTYTVSASGQSLQVTNQPVGAASTFKLVLAGQYNGVWTALTLYSCVSSKLSFATKLNDFMIPDFEFSAMADLTGRVIAFNSDASAAA